MLSLRPSSLSAAYTVNELISLVLIRNSFVFSLENWPKIFTQSDLDKSIWIGLSLLSSANSCLIEGLYST